MLGVNFMFFLLTIAVSLNVHVLASLAETVEAAMNAMKQQLQKMEYAVDFTVSASPSTLKCIEDAHYSTVFIQVYKPSNGGSVNTDGIQNLISVGTTNLGTEVYVTPTTSGKTGQQMFDESYEALKASGIVLRTIWIQITTPINWSSDIKANVDIIRGFVTRAQSYGITPGIYTSWNDWVLITGSSTEFKTALLWYWNTLGYGPVGETPINFDDFRPFGGWSAPSVKQFALMEGLCDIAVNRSIYSTAMFSH